METLIGRPVRQKTHSEVYVVMASAFLHCSTEIVDINFFDNESVEDVYEAVFVEVLHTINYRVNS